MEPPSDMHPPYTTNTSSRLLAFALLCVSAYLVSLLVRTFAAEPISDGFANLLQDPWGVSALLDYTIGAVFALTYLWHRNGPSLLYIPCRVFAVVTPFMGNFVLLTYVAFLIFSGHGLFRPYSTMPPMSPTFKKPVLLISLFTMLLVIFIAVCTWALVTRGITGMQLVEPWIIMSFMDNVVGLIFTTMYVVQREGGLSQWRNWILWFVCLALFGNGATCVYVLLILKDSVLMTLDFPIVLLAKKQVLVSNQQQQEQPLVWRTLRIYFSRLYETKSFTGPKTWIIRCNQSWQADLSEHSWSSSLQQ